MLRDPWNIRLLPYYPGGALAVVAHAFRGVRIVMLAHHAPRASADRVLAGHRVRRAAGHHHHPRDVRLRLHFA